MNMASILPTVHIYLYFFFHVPAVNTEVLLLFCRIFFYSYPDKKIFQSSVRAIIRILIGRRLIK